MQHIMANNKYLLSCLTHLLKDESLQIYAADCLLGQLIYNKNGGCQLIFSNKFNKWWLTIQLIYNKNGG